MDNDILPASAPPVEILDYTKDPKWFTVMIDECKSLLIEAKTASNWVIICAYHSIGSAINDYQKHFEGRGLYGQKIAEKVARSMGVNRRYIFDAMRFAKKYPDLDTFPGDKSMHWARVRDTYILDNVEKDKEKQARKKKCPSCGTEF